MNRNVMITCALTGAGDTVGRSEHVPVTPEQIAASGIAAARAGATIVHVHVRDPETGKGSRDVALYREVVERIRASDIDVIINTTAGMGGDQVPQTRLGVDGRVPGHHAEAARQEVGDPAATDHAGADTGDGAYLRRRPSHRRLSERISRPSSGVATVAPMLSTIVRARSTS